jgi:hypothetical protein
MFSEFLKTKLKSFKIDTSVYHSYLLSILEDNSIDDDEKRETVTDIISSLIVSMTHSSRSKLENHLKFAMHRIHLLTHS